jgi:hypothetical protein
MRRRVWEKHVLSVFEALGSIPSAHTKRRKTKEKEFGTRVLSR